MISLSLELFGDDSRQRVKLLLMPLRSLSLGDGALLRKHLDPGMRRPWVARVLGLDAKWQFQREFIRGRKDYTHANGVGSRGVYLWFNIEPGLYEINEQVSWRSWDRRYELIETGSRRRLTRDEAQTWARDHSESTS